MSNTANKELEKSLKRALEGLKDFSREQEEKRNKKYWSEIKVPFTLHEGLSKFTKYELDEIRKSLNIKNASSLKKAELIALLQERIPMYLEQIYLLWDQERFTLLTNIADNGGIFAASNVEPEQIEYFRATGLIYTGTYEGKQILAVPVELIEPIIAMENNGIERATVKRNTEWIKLTCGLLYYYGTLSGSQLVNMLEKYTKEKIDFIECVNVIQDANTYRKEIYIDEDGFSNRRVFDPKRVKQEHKVRGNVPFYPFTKQQLLTAGEPGFVERNQSYTQLVNFLTNHFEINIMEADSIVEECVYATRIGESPNHVFQFLSNRFEFESMETVQALMDKAIHLMNNTREWFLKGHTSTELSAQGREHLLPLPSKLNSNETQKVVKVGRNEPCPCGSGKKYKKCCGR
ncbi:SEC-C metal-binding domain-containing protein [Bacillus sp. Marseille-P3661]|uniref:SEC-C metal-binding domain-containing protein n=1 Tax=Bacillus sp. Marseille-P3661 TaxID=1936234 RepID=UPI000C853420|nr:SEC-C metal-binding domain-containing protein [Bacillus sp. Marseille-P3661]